MAEPAIEAWVVPEYLFAIEDNDIVCDGCAQVLWFIYLNGDDWTAQNEEGMSYPVEALTAAQLRPGAKCAACDIDLPKKEHTP